MKIYFPVQDALKGRAEIRDALKRLVEKQFSGFKTDSLSSFSYDRTDQFFVKSPHAVLWGRVYFEPFSDNDVELLGFELKRLEQILKQRLHAHIFFTEWNMKKGDVEYPCADYFHYRFIQSEAEKSLLIEKVLPAGLEFRPDKAVNLFGTSNPDKYHFAKSSQLSREELAELIDLNLELKNPE
jgi:hypothetical protein